MLYLHIENFVSKVTITLYYITESRISILTKARENSYQKKECREADM